MLDLTGSEMGSIQCNSDHVDLKLEDSRSKVHGAKVHGPARPAKVGHPPDAGTLWGGEA